MYKQTDEKFGQVQLQALEHEELRWKHEKQKLERKTAYERPAREQEEKMLQLKQEEGEAHQRALELVQVQHAKNQSRGTFNGVWVRKLPKARSELERTEVFICHFEDLA